MKRQIVALGGGVLAPETANFELEAYLLEQTDRPRPRVLFVPTATGDSAALIARFYESYARFDCTAAHLPLFARTPADLRSFVLGFDLVHVGGGNTRSMLAVWRDWNLDAILREAYERGVVLAGSSAGAICWFDQGLTDSVAGSLMRLDCLGLLAGSFCPHYSSEVERRPTYERLVGDGTLAGGIAADDGAGMHYIDEAPHHAIVARPGARVYGVTRATHGASERVLDALTLVDRSK